MTTEEQRLKGLGKAWFALNCKEAHCLECPLATAMFQDTTRNGAIAQKGEKHQCMNLRHPLKSRNTNFAYFTATSLVRSGNAGPTRTLVTDIVNTAPAIMLALS